MALAVPFDGRRIASGRSCIVLQSQLEHGPPAAVTCTTCPLPSRISCPVQTHIEPQQPRLGLRSVAVTTGSRKLVNHRFIARGINLEYNATPKIETAIKKETTPES